MKGGFPRWLANARDAIERTWEQHRPLSVFPGDERYLTLEMLPEVTQVQPQNLVRAYLLHHDEELRNILQPGMLYGVFSKSERGYEVGKWRAWDEK